VPNRLAAERSPYLLQHQDNPVDWYPWGQDAFDRAQREQKPIFLSVGYSTCHWCHVMEHESFESEEVAAVLNREFVSIKVDREERPDVDRVYMTFVQATTGGGGWPMSVWLTPDLKPFYGGTYFPPVSRWGRPGLMEVLAEIARVWRDERDRVVTSAGNIVERLERLGDQPSGGRTPPGPEALAIGVREFAAVYDARYGGFGTAPKFPRPSELLFLLREHARTGDDPPKEMAEATLAAMARGGVRDHIGGGFHRYSVDREWRVPHFEKMLYDQAQLVLAYLEAAQATGRAPLLDVALDTLEYVRRDLADGAGGFYSAEDADSVPPDPWGPASAGPSEDAGKTRGPASVGPSRSAPRKTEGAFYLWTDAELRGVVGDEAAAMVAQHFGVQPAGNAPHDPQGEFSGRNILYEAIPADALARSIRRPLPDVHATLRRAREALFARRATRPRPHLDDKVLTAWNGLAIAAFARASRALAGGGMHRARAAAKCRDDARRAADFLRRHLWDGTTLRRRFRGGEAGIAAYAEDHAFLVFGLLELFQADGDPQWLEWALSLQKRQDELFADADGGWFSTSGDDPSVLLRLKDQHDGAEPSASSIGALNLLLLAHLVDDERLSAAAERTLRLAAGAGGSAARTMPMMMAALSTYHAGVSQLVIAGEPDRADAMALRQAAAQYYLPFTLVVPLMPCHRRALAALLPWTSAMWRDEGPAAAYVCRRFACERPSSSPAELSAQLESLAHQPRSDAE
jgi:uncharacterized protein YyaL (SSP411 family)